MIGSVFSWQRSKHMLHRHVHTSSLYVPCTGQWLPAGGLCLHACKPAGTIASLSLMAFPWLCTLWGVPQPMRHVPWGVVCGRLGLMLVDVAGLMVGSMWCVRHDKLLTGAHLGSPPAYLWMPACARMHAMCCTALLPG